MPESSPTVAASLPRDMTFTDDNLVSVVSYAVLFVIAALGNLGVFVNLLRKRRRRLSPPDTVIMHLCIADLIVTFVFMPLEITWQLTVAWLAGDTACRVLMFMRAFGLYLSSFVLVTISLDRYFAIHRPLSLHESSDRRKFMLTFAWLCSTVASVPQVGVTCMLLCTLNILFGYWADVVIIITA